MRGPTFIPWASYGGTGRSAAVEETDAHSHMGLAEDPVTNLAVAVVGVAGLGRVAPRSEPGRRPHAGSDGRDAGLGRDAGVLIGWKPGSS